ncbi:TetR/AcrR family transcriptional regulator [Mangrovicoccus algicola]|uniref:TetR family transcriptional regulator n=1 Tax=Mangrovicoccus algicola TaxID=2771008 RepID=A0A8J7CII6_9RHOB|nr:TetR family transcriptional regulator [Mangrovicoccus algicola]MBE3639585.1 TetR family transcriptional regulator [Mangrovicoccus algicola]
MDTSQPPRRKPGRPKAGADLRDRILDEAEACFAAAGFAGAALREIATRAGVNQALLRYYFGSKQDLFDAVFRRRGGMISGQRHVLLDRALAAPDLSVESVLRAYLRPQWEMKLSGPGGAAFIALQARVHAEPEAHALELRREVYDPSLRRYIDALCDLLPALPRAVVSMRVAFLVGTYLFMLNDLGRLTDLSEGQIHEMPPEHMLDQLVVFLAAGLRAPEI